MCPSLVPKKIFSWILFSWGSFLCEKLSQAPIAGWEFIIKQVLAKWGISPFLYEELKEEILNFLSYIISLFFSPPWMSNQVWVLFMTLLKILGKRISCAVFSIITPSIIIYIRELYSRKNIFRRKKSPNPYLSSHYYFGVVIAQIFEHMFLFLFSYYSKR